jgi:hypothetical protein
MGALLGAQFVTQVGPAFRENPRILDIFGVHEAVYGVQTNFLIPEGFSTKERGDKSIVMVASSLWHYLVAQQDMRLLTATEISLNADNCAVRAALIGAWGLSSPRPLKQGGCWQGQNKNQFMVHFLAWLAVTHTVHFPGSRLTCITLTFPVAGHGKNINDSLFGVIKRKFYRSNVGTPKQMRKVAAHLILPNDCRRHALAVLWQVVEASSSHNKAVCACQVAMYDWYKFLAQFFVPIKTEVLPLASVQLLRFRVGKPGVTEFRCSPPTASDAAWQPASLLRQDVTLDVMRDPARYRLKPLCDFALPRGPMPPDRVDVITAIARKYVSYFNRASPAEFLGCCCFGMA